MNVRSLGILVVAFGMCLTSLAGTATFALVSPQAGTSVQPGATISWSVQVAVSTGDNVGLALFACDLVQDAANPAKFDIPYGTAGSIPALLSGFNRPGGITNPGEGGQASGFVGVQRGTAGSKNLIQIGGGQNTFGQAGSGFGTDVNVESGIGQSGAQLVLSGSFPAPATSGSYTFRLENAIANVLGSVATPPAFSPVVAATTNTTGATFTVTVSSAPAVCKGDMNCDGQKSFADINPFVQYLSAFASWQAAFPGCNPLNGDINNDGVYGQGSFADINPFVNVMVNQQGPCQ